MNQIVAFDVETPNSCNDRICAIGLTVIQDGLIIDSLYYLVNPEVEFDYQNIQIHGIRPADVIDAPTFPKVWAEISELMHSSLVVAHNASFDLCVLRKTLSAYCINETLLYYVCTLQIARKVITGVDNYQLTTLCNYAGIDLNHHHAGSDSDACAKLLCILIDSGINLDNYIKPFELAEKPAEKKQSNTKAISSQTQSLLVLKGILSGVTCDNILTESEVSYLQSWLNENRELEGNYPFDKVSSILSDALADSILEQNELDSMLILFKQIFDPVGSSCPVHETYSVSGKNICLTGEFDRGERNNVEIELSTIGVTIQKSVTKQTDFLIVGGQGSAMWCAGNYGNKVKKALELQEKGSSIQIIRETDFYFSGSL